MDHVRLRRLLDEPPASPAWPPNVNLVPFTSDNASLVHGLLTLGYESGGGTVPKFEQWWENLSTDSEYDPALCFTVFSAGTLIGVAQCWTSSYVKDLVVHPSWRRQGVATALLLNALHVFRQRGAAWMDLKVETGNGGAMALYRALGFNLA